MACSRAIFRRPVGLVAGGATILVALATMTAGAVAGTHPLLRPDLVTLRVGQHDLIVKRSHGKTFLRLTNEIGNRGRGPLEIYSSATSTNCDGDGNPSNDRAAFQRIFRDANGDGAFERAIDIASRHRRFGCKHFHPAHQHWHVLDFSRYRLKREKTGHTVVRSTKIGFCIFDDWRAFHRPHSPTSGYYPKQGTCDRDSTDGLSVGWADTYNYRLPGQQLNVTGLPSGRYCLVSTADPHDRLRESKNSNNTRRTLIKLNPRTGTVDRLSGPCSLG